MPMTYDRPQTPGQSMGTLLSRVLIRRPVIALVYHAISPVPPAHVRHIFPSKSPEMFDADLEFLRTHYNPVSYPQVAAHMAGGRPLPPRAVMITFDDGYAECFHRARPLLLEHRVPCTFFLTTDLIDNRSMFYRNKYSLCVDAFQALQPERTAALLRAAAERFDRTFPDEEVFLRWLRSLKYTRQGELEAVCAMLEVNLERVLEEDQPYLTTAQVQALAAEGFTLGAHGRNHAKLNLLDEKDQKQEILESCRAVAGLSEQEEVPFAFPFSGYGISRPMLVRLRAEHPWLGLFFDSHGLRYSRRPVLHRVWADPPPGPGGGPSNLGQLLDAAYRDALSWRWKYLWSMFFARLKNA